MFPKRIISFLSSFVTLFSFIPSVLADDSDYIGTVSWNDYLLYQISKNYSSDPILGGFVQNVAGIMCESVCSTSPDQLHHATSVTDEFEKDPLGGKGSYTWATCTYCHERFKVYASDLQQSYDKQVKKLHNKVVVSGASLHCYPSSFVNMKTVRSLSEIEQLKYVHSPCGCSRTFPDSYHLVEHVHDGHRHLSHYNLYFQVPVSGNYYFRIRI